MVWFIYLPLMAAMALKISTLWRQKFITGVTYSADTFAYIVLIHLLWPNRSEQYFLLAVQVTYQININTYFFVIYFYIIS